MNFYPIGNEKAQDGSANIAVGLGKYIVDGGQTLRFSPRHPHNILQMSTMDFALRETQTRFYALDLKNLADQFSVDDSFNLLRLNLKDADADGLLVLGGNIYAVGTNEGKDWNIGIADPDEPTDTVAAVAV